jgi:hypothetical protein
VRVSFHANACAVAGIPAVIDPGRWALLARREHELGIQFPAAVAEWYAIDGAVEYAAEHSTHRIIQLGELGLAADGRDLAVGAAAGPTRSSSRYARPARRPPSERPRRRLKRHRRMP